MGAVEAEEAADPHQQQWGSAPAAQGQQGFNKWTPQQPGGGNSGAGAGSRAQQGAAFEAAASGMDLRQVSSALSDGLCNGTSLAAWLQAHADVLN